MLPKLYRIAHPRTPWRVVYSDPSQRDRHDKPRRFVRHFKAEAEAIEHHAKLLRVASTVGTSGLAMDARARADYYAGRQVLDTAGHNGTSVTEALRTFVEERPARARPNTPVAPLLALFVKAKQVEDNAAARTVGNLRTRVAAWIKRENIVTLADIDDAALLALKQRKGVGARTKINDLGAVSVFLSWLKERRLRGPNELLEMKRPATDAHHPRVLKPDQVRALLQAALELKEGRLVRWLALQLLAGLRPNEAAQVTPDQIRLNATPPFIRVLRGKKRNRPRPAPVLRNFAAWWHAAAWPAATTEDEKQGRALPPLHREARDRRLFDAIRARAGLVVFQKVPGKGGWEQRERRVANHWQSDICRHTWISVRLQQTKDEARVAYEAGTSVEMIHGHYLDLLDDAEVRAIERVRPKLTARGKPTTSQV